MSKTVDMSSESYKIETKEVNRCKGLCFRINHMEPDSPEIRTLAEELMHGSCRSVGVKQNTKNRASVRNG